MTTFAHFMLPIATRVRITYKQFLKTVVKPETWHSNKTALLAMHCSAPERCITGAIAVWLAQMGWADLLEVEDRPHCSQVPALTRPQAPALTHTQALASAGGPSGEKIMDKCNAALDKQGLLGALIKANKEPDERVKALENSQGSVATYSVA